MCPELNHDPCERLGQIFSGVGDANSAGSAIPQTKGDPRRTPGAPSPPRRFRAERLNLLGGLVVTEFSLDEVRRRRT